MKTNKFIIGGGISGLIFAFYNKDFTIISPDIGGRLNHKFFHNIIYLHATTETRAFLQDIGVSAEERVQRMKYCYEGKILNDADANVRVAMIRKKVGDDSFQPKDLNLSTDDSFIRIFEVKYEDVMLALKCDADRAIKEEVIRITDTHVVTSERAYEYKQLVSTIPAPVFWSLRQPVNFINGAMFESKPVTFVLAEQVSGELMFDNKTDMLYIADKSPLYTRVSKRPNTRGENMYLFEFTGSCVDDAHKSIPEGFTVVDSYVDSYGVISTNLNNIPPKNTLFVGRFAKWEHSVKQQDVVRDARFNFDFRNIWNAQRMFQLSHANFNDLDDRRREELSKEFLLHLHAELTEILNCMNYKKHKPRHAINKAELKDELIDAFKYLLNIMIFWDIDVAEFVKLFNDKTDVVMRRFESEMLNHKKNKV